MLRMLFQEIPRSILPLKSNLEEMSVNETVASENMSQAVCGSLFTEMWTNDVGGFPLPKLVALGRLDVKGLRSGCYYGPLYTDVAQNGRETPSYREVFVEFKPSHPLKDQCSDANGRQQTCVYQLVMCHAKGAERGCELRNMRVEEEEFQLNREILSLYTSPGCVLRIEAARSCAGRSGYATICGPRYSVIEYGAVT